MSTKLIISERAIVCLLGVAVLVPTLGCHPAALPTPDNELVLNRAIAAPEVDFVSLDGNREYTYCGFTTLAPTEFKS